MTSVLELQPEKPFPRAPGQNSGRATRWIAITLFVAASACSQETQTKDDSKRLSFAASGAPVGELLPSPADDSPIRIWRPGKPEDSIPLDFKPLGMVVPTDKIRLSNGKEINLADWPSVAISSTGENCTSTLIGPKTILTAAHCVDAGQPVGAPNQERMGKIHIGGDDLDLKCVMADDYKKLPPNAKGGVRGTRDFALCDLENGTVDLNRVPPEAIDANTPVADGAAVLLMGYGCTDLDITSFGKLTYKQADGKLRMGDELIDGTGLTSAPETAGIWSATKAFVRVPGYPRVEPSICPGDSGGPVVVGAATGNPAARRRIIAVNSAVGWQKNGAGWTIYSYSAPLASDAFRALIKKYVGNRSDVIICGVNAGPGAKGCRNAS